MASGGRGPPRGGMSGGAHNMAGLQGYFPSSNPAGTMGQMTLGVANPAGSNVGGNSWSMDLFGANSQVVPQAGPRGIYAGEGAANLHTDVFAELDVLTRQGSQSTVPFNMLATARPIARSYAAHTTANTPAGPSASTTLPDLTALGLGGVRPASGGATPQPPPPGATTPVTGASEALMMQVASGLAAIASAMSGGSAGNAIQVGQIGSAADPKFPEWDGKEYTIQTWIANATAAKDVHHTSDKHAITYARIKLQKWIQNIYPENEEEQPKTWTDFTMWLLSRVGPADWQLMTYANLMTGQCCLKDNCLQQYISEFMQLKRMCNITDEGLLKAFFLKGLGTNAYLTFAVMNDMDPNWTLQQLIDRARRVHTGVAHPFTMVGLSGVAPHGALGSQVPPYRGPTAPPMTSGPTPMDLDVLETRLATMVTKAVDGRMSAIWAERANAAGMNPIMRLAALEPPYYQNTPAITAPASPLTLTAPPQASSTAAETSREDSRRKSRSGSQEREGYRDRSRGGERSHSGSRAANERGRRGSVDRRPADKEVGGQRSRSNSKERRPLKCWNCQEEGHREAECPHPRRPRTPGRREGESPKRIQCYCCGELGHIAPRCPLKRAWRDGSKAEEEKGGKGSGK